MASTRQMYTHGLEPLRGYFDMKGAGLIAIGKMSANVTIDPVYAGRCVHKNSAGEFEMGAAGAQMPMFLWQNTDSYDVFREHINATDQSLEGVGGEFMTAFVASGGFELETTEFDTAQTYAINDYLRGQTSNTVAATGGVLTNQGITLYTNTVCGMVSGPEALNANRVSVLPFYTVFLPGTA